MGENLPAFDPTDPTASLTGVGNLQSDLRVLTWGETEDTGDSAGAYMIDIREQARDALGTAMGGKTPTERDLNELDRQLELMMSSVGGNRMRGHMEQTYFFASEEDERVSMPHYAVESERTAALFNIRNRRPDQVKNATSAERDPSKMAVMLAVALTLPYTEISSRDDDVFVKEKWRAHTNTDVLQSATSSIPLFTAPLPTKPHSTTLKGGENVRFDEVTDRPLFPDGHSAWFEGWDKFLDSPFPEEAAR
jgi:hypothetical protein